MYLVFTCIWWSLCTLYLHVSGGVYVPCIYMYLVEFMYLVFTCIWWSLCTLYLHVSGGVYVPCIYMYLVEFMYLVFTCMPGESYHRCLRSLLFACVTSFEC